MMTSVPPGDGAAGWGWGEGGIAEGRDISRVFEFGTDPLGRLFLHSPPSAGLTSKLAIG